MAGFTVNWPAGSKKGPFELFCAIFEVFDRQNARFSYFSIMTFFVFFLPIVTDRYLVNEALTKSHRGAVEEMGRIYAFWIPF